MYDSFADAQRAGGVLQHALMRPADDPNMVLVVHTFDSPEKAHAFFGNAELKDAISRVRRRRVVASARVPSGGGGWKAVTVAI